MADRLDLSEDARKLLRLHIHWPSTLHAEEPTGILAWPEC
jgi:hypothetical protein